MGKSKEEFVQLVYDLVCGSLDLEAEPVEESKYVGSEYEPGMFCEKAYNELYEANQRLCERVGASDGEDEDVECIISNMMDIQEHLCKKMFEYGWKFAQMEKDVL